MSPQHLLRFLYLEAVEATDNRAERMLRPAVISADSQSPTQYGRLQQDRDRLPDARHSGESKCDLSTAGAQRNAVLHRPGQPPLRLG